MSFVAGSILVAGVAHAGGNPVASGTDKINVNLYGQVNRAIMFADNGKYDNTFHVDNDNSSSRLGIKGKLKVNDNITTGVKFEAEWQSNASNEMELGPIPVDATSTGNGSNFDLRKMELFIKSASVGTITIGQGDTASNGTSEIDLSGTKVAGFADVGAFAGGIKFYDKTTGALSSRKIKDVLTQMDGLSRMDRLRYDSPSFSGFTVSASGAEKDAADIALRYSGSMGDTRIKAGIAYANPGRDKDYNQVNGSVSVLLAGGFNVTFAAGQRNVDSLPFGSDDPTFFYGKLGYTTKAITDIGATSFSIDYMKAENVKSQSNAEEGTLLGIQFVQKLSQWGTELYAGYRTHEFDDNSGDDYDTIGALMTGLRIKF